VSTLFESSSGGIYSGVPATPLHVLPLTQVSPRSAIFAWQTSPAGSLPENPSGTK
jgi:hypothetical protein